MKIAKRVSVQQVRRIADRVAGCSLQCHEWSTMPAGRPGRRKAGVDVELNVLGTPAQAQAVAKALRPHGAVQVVGQFVRLTRPAV
jgi:hypothetical protein